ncbi:MAG: intermembrane transport protein PqiB [Pikeienuella sp.]
MTNTPSQNTAPNIGEPKITHPTGRRRLSFVWVFPLIAILVAIVLIWREYAERGPTIEITFPTASGLSVGETPLKFRSVEVGRVEEIHFAEDLSKVIATIRLSGEVAKFIDSSAQFWVVRPEVSARGISGLETVISGSYIEGDWDADAGKRKKRFTALDAPPLTTTNTPGKRVVLRSPEGGSLSIGAPIFFRQVEVGHVESKRLTEDGEAVEFSVFVEAPNDKRLTAGTRFWNVSGVDLNLGTDGARLRIASLASLIQGGASFDNVAGRPAEPIADGHVYDLYSTETLARDLAMDAGPGSQLLMNIHFVGSLHGLRVGAPVQYQGLRIGRVSKISAKVKRDIQTFSNRVTVAISPTLLGLDDGDVEGTLNFLDTAVRRGLRAQLTSSSLLTGALLVAFVNVDQRPGEEPKRIRRFPNGLPRMPSIASNLAELTGSVEGVLRRIEGLPIEELLENAVLVLENANKIVASDELRAAPGEAVDAIAAIRDLAASPAITNTVAEAEALMTALRLLAESDDIAAARRDLAATLANTAAITDTLEKQRTMQEMTLAIIALRKQLENPQIETTIASLERSLDAATALLGSPTLADTPGSLNAALDSMRDFLTAPGLQEAPEELTAALVAARKVLEDLAEGDAAGQIASAATSARELLDDPALRRLFDEAASAAAALRAILDQPGAENLPAAATKALQSAAVVMDQMGEENLALVATEALEGVGRATEAITRAAADVPALLRKVGSAATRADDLLASVSVGSELNYEAVTAIREIRDAARAVTELADLLSRDPNSLILGK